VYVLGLLAKQDEILSIVNYSDWKVASHLNKPILLMAVPENWAWN